MTAAASSPLPLRCGCDESAPPAVAGRRGAARADRALARLRARAEPARPGARALGRRPEPRGRDAGLARAGRARLGARRLARRARRPRARAPAARAGRAEAAPAPARAPRGRASTSPARSPSRCSSRTCTGAPGSASTGSRASSGPVHRNAIPLLAALALAAAALAEAGRAPARLDARRRPRAAAPPARPATASLSFAPLASLAPSLVAVQRAFAGTAARGLTPTRERKETDEIRPGRRRRGRTHARARERRLGARDHEPARRQVEGDAAVHALGADRGGGRDHDRDRADRPRRLLDRLVRALARLEAHGGRRPAPARSA